MAATFLAKLTEMSDMLLKRIDNVRDEIRQEVAEVRFQPQEHRYEPPPPMGYDEPLDGSHVPISSSMLSAGAGAGLIPPPAQVAGPNRNPAVFNPNQAIADPNARLVAFIPKSDQLNPRALTFDSWINGKLIRTRRGEVGMMPLGHAVDLARGGHGYVVDVAAMSTVNVQTQPDYSRPDDSGWPSEVSPVQPRATSIPFA